MTDNIKDLPNNTQSFLQKTKLDHHKITETVKKDTRLIISAFEGMSKTAHPGGRDLSQPHSGEKLNGPLHDGYNDLDPHRHTRKNLAEKNTYRTLPNT